MFSQPAVLIAVVGATAVLGMVAALTPLFLSSASSAALQRELGGRCPASFGGETVNFDSIPRAREQLIELTSIDPSFLPPRLYLEGGLVTASNANGMGLNIPIRFTGRDEFRDHIELVEGDHGDGVYIDDVASRDLEAHPGDTIQFSIQGDSYEFVVQAVYRGIYDRIADPYWCFLEDVLAVTIMGDPQPPLVLVDVDYFTESTELFRRVFASYGGGIGSWEVPVRVDGLTVAEANAAAAILDQTDEELVDHTDNPSFFAGPSIHSDLPLVTKRVQALADALTTSILPLAAVVFLAAAALVGGAGSYWIDRRKIELQYLSTLGAGPGAIAYKAAAEFFIPTIIGGGVGCALANVIIPLVGPSPDVEVSARMASVWATVAAIVVSLAAVAVIVAVRSRTLLDHRPQSRRNLRWRIPLIVVSIAGAALIRSAIGETAVVTEENQLVGSVDPLVLFLPLLTFIAAVLIAAEIVIRLFPLIRKAGAHGHATYLASRRIVSAPTLVIALIAGAALPVATLVYAASLTRSATSTIDAKGKTFIGADVATPVFGPIDPPGILADVSTVVIKAERADLNGQTVDVLAIDFDTFERGAFWEEEFAQTPLQTILDGVRGDSDGPPLDAYVANGVAVDGELKLGSASTTLHILGDLETFPGSRRTRPLVVVDRDRFINTLADESGRLLGVRYLMWTLDRTESEIETALAEADIGYAYTTAASTTLDQLRFASLVWTFDFLEIYSALAGLIAIGAVLLYVDTRQRARNLSYALARRMGLTRGEHMVASMLEIGSLTVLGAVVGIIAGRIPARQLYLILDAVQETPPPPRWVGALNVGVIAVTVAVIVSLLASLLAQRTADRADTSELLRHGE
jgi:putative ABC transport system permease protein